ncbi:MAG: hypothetical protein JWO66_1208, partial [Candidatus Eremiobacteraeota bacterium]|nr:hypothetical protein [Candidatus Eremiobacteraeota bacterium]
IVSSRLKPAYPFLAWVEAFSEAALIGGLADWFAVVALFRHPGGLPLPHTAIVPENKDRIGIQLGLFVEQNFLTPEILVSKLRELDLARRLLRWLAVPANCRALLANVRALVPRLLEAVDDVEVRRPSTSTGASAAAPPASCCTPRSSSPALRPRSPLSRRTAAD